MSEETMCRFVVIADSGPQTLMRVLGLFAQRDFTPVRVEAGRSGQKLSIVVEQDALAPAAAILLAEKIRASVCVWSVDLSMGVSVNGKGSVC